MLGVDFCCRGAKVFAQASQAPGEEGADSTLPLTQDLGDFPALLLFEESEGNHFLFGDRKSGQGLSYSFVFIGPLPVPQPGGSLIIHGLKFSLLHTVLVHQPVEQASGPAAPAEMHPQLIGGNGEEPGRDRHPSPAEPPVMPEGLEEDFGTQVPGEIPVTGPAKEVAEDRIEMAVEEDAQSLGIVPGSEQKLPIALGGFGHVDRK